MSELTIYDQNKKKLSARKLVAAWEGPVKRSSIYETALWQLAGRRAGTQSTKGRSEVTGSGRKIYRQKGTGNARHGDRQANIFVGGGIAGGPKPRDWSTRLPQKERQQAVRSLLIHKLKKQQIVVVDQLKFKEIKTKQAQAWLDRWEIKSALVVLEKADGVVLKSLRNIPHIATCSPSSLNVGDLLTYELLVMTQPALEQVEASWMEA